MRIYPARACEEIMIIKATDQKGVFTVHRRDGEVPFAEMHAPRARGGRRWGIKYRDGDRPERPFDPMVFNVGAPNRKKAIEEMEHTLRVCNDYQLGLTREIPCGK